MTFLRILSLTSFCVSLQAAEPVFEWVAAGGGVKNDKTRAVAFDREGNVFLAGETTGEGTFGDVKRQDLGATDFFLAKTTPDGKFLWVRSLGGSLIDRGYGVAVDANGNAYVTGHYQSQDAQVNGKPLPNAGDYDVFVAKYDRDGQLLWIKHGGGAGYDYGHGIALDSKGDVVVAGAIAGEAKFGSQTVNADSKGRAIFCAKYSADGELRWVKSSSGGFSGSGHGIGVDGQDNLYIGGSASGSGHWGKLELKAAPGGQSALMLKLTRDGEGVWANMIAGKPSAGFHELTVDSSGRSWGAGMFKGDLQVEPPVKTTDVKDSDGLLAHFNAEGQLVWTHYLQGPKTDYCLGVTTDHSGRVFVTGEFSEIATFAGKTLQSLGGTDIYTAAFDVKGGLEWLLPNGGTKGDNAYTMAWHPQGWLVIGGGCAGPASFGKAEMTSLAAAEAYAAKIRLKP